MAANLVLKKEESEPRLDLYASNNDSRLQLPPASPTRPLLKRKRFVDRKSGKFAVRRLGLNQLVWSYFRTGYHALIDMHWGLFLTILVIFYLSSFAFFGLIYWRISDECLENVAGWPEAFFFSVQTGMTIGYGSMYPEGCRPIIYTITIQSLFGLISDALLLGLAFEKLARPEPAANAFLFSKKASIYTREEKLCFVCRVAWVKPTQLVEAHVRLYISNHRETPEGEKLFHFAELDIQEGNSSFIFLGLPHDIVHIIDETSPLYRKSSQDLYQNDTELVVIVEGISAFTSDTIQGNFSYISSDIVWGKPLPQIVSRDSDRGFIVDYSRFNDISPESTTPNYGARNIGV